MNIRNMLSAAVLSVAAASANAAVITDVEAINQELSLNPFDNSPYSLEWTHDITDAGFTPGGNQSVVSAELSISFTDDERDRWYNPASYETAVIRVENLDFQDGAWIEVDTGDWGGSLGVTALTRLNLEGLLDVRVTALTGDFFIGNSVLEAVVEEVAVPEPASLALLGLGLLGLGVARRRVSA